MKIRFTQTAAVQTCPRPKCSSVNCTVQSIDIIATGFKRMIARQELFSDRTVIQQRNRALPNHVESFGSSIYGDKLGVLHARHEKLVMDTNETCKNVTVPGLSRGLQCNGTKIGRFAQIGAIFVTRLVATIGSFMRSVRWWSCGIS